MAVLASLVGRRGWLACARLTLDALEAEDRLVLSGRTEDGEELDETQCRRLFDLPAKLGERCDIPAATAAASPGPETEKAAPAALLQPETATGDPPPPTGSQEAPNSAPAGPASTGPAAEGGPARATLRTDTDKEPWVPKRATPRDPNKPRAVPRPPPAPTAPQPEEPDHA